VEQHFWNTISYQLYLAIAVGVGFVAAAYSIWLGFCSIRCARRSLKLQEEMAAYDRPVIEIRIRPQACNGEDVAIKDIRYYEVTVLNKSHRAISFWNYEIKWAANSQAFGRSMRRTPWQNETIPATIDGQCPKEFAIPVPDIYDWTNTSEFCLVDGSGTKWTVPSDEIAKFVECAREVDREIGFSGPSHRFTRKLGAGPPPWADAAKLEFERIAEQQEHQKTA
jgi:hypothetical protein